VVTHREAPKIGDLAGRKIGGYTLERLLGEGGMGSVYLASNSRIGKKVAVKVIARKYTADPELVERFFREAKAVAALDDANIIEIYDCHEFDDGLTYISMKFIEGQSLAAQMLGMRVVPMDAAVAIALQIASGLDAAHELGIVHRDIKPENILISRRWRRRFFATIVDFGIAKLLDSHLASNYRTQTAMVMGTLAYMAPEQARSERSIDARADIYSLGVVLYEMLTGRRPYDEETVYGLVEKHAQRAAFPRPRELRSDIPQAIDELLLDMLQVDRRKRPASMKDVGQRLAKGVANGDLMLRTLASRLSVDQAAPAQNAGDITLVGDVESSITRWTPARSMVRGRSGGTMLGSGVIMGVLLGISVMYAASGHATEPATNQLAPPVVADADHLDANPGQVAPGQAAQQGAGVARKNVDDVAKGSSTTPTSGQAATQGGAGATRGSADDRANGPTTATKPEPTATKPELAGPAPAVSNPAPAAPKSGPAAPGPEATVAKPDVTATPEVVAKPDAGAAKVSAPVSDPGSSPTKPSKREQPTKVDSVVAGAKPEAGATRPATRPAADATAHQDGYLVIRIHSWADIWIDGKGVGTAPLRVKLAAGRHEVKLENESHSETVSVNVGGKADTVIEKSW
jgi:serine/threonine-protein kinase